MLVTPFPTMFSNLSKNKFQFLVIFILSSANAVNLDLPKILSLDEDLKI